MSIFGTIGDAMLLCWSFGTLLSQLFPKASDRVIEDLRRK